MTNGLKIKKTDSIELLLKHLLPHEIRIPYFQREYTWNKECIKNFINDILNSQTDNYFLGTIILKNETGDLKILDGQQRITTLILIFFQLKRLIESHKEKIDEDLKSINNGFKNLDFKSSNLKDGDILKNIIDNDWNDNIKDYNIKNSLYWENLKSIDKRLSEIKSQKNWTWEKIYDQFKKTAFALVILNDKYNENDIFEKINSTGKPLNQFDLVKNFLFSKMFDEAANILKKEPNKYIQPKLEQIDNFINKIEDKSLDESRQKLIRHFVAYKTGILEKGKNNDIYKKFKKMLDEEYKKDQKSASKMFDSLIKFSIYYKYIKNKCWKDNKKFSKPFLTLYNELDTFIVLIIRIFEENSKICDDKKQPFSFDNNQENEILNSLLLIENYIYRRKFARLKNKIITRKIPTIIFNNFQYKQDDNEKLSTSEKIYFELFLLPNKDKEYRVPDERELIDGMKENDAYPTDKKTTQTFLFRLGTNDAKEQLNIGDFDIEHVLPQNHSKWKIEESNEIERYKHTIGNLTLTAYNREYSNETFEVKKKMMKEKKDLFPLNDYFENKNINNWDIEEIKKRTQYLYSIYKQVWNLEKYENNSKLNNLKSKDDNKKDQGINYNHEDYDSDKNYKNTLKNRSNFKKIQSIFTRELINNIIKCYCVDGMGYVKIENRYFEQYKFDGWVFQSIREALEINKDDKGNISESYIDLYIANKNKLIDKFLKFIKEIK